MKLILVAVLLFASPFVGHYSFADEDSANSARSSENSPVIPAAEGEGELTLDNESGASTKNPKTLRQQLDTVCKANGDPAACESKKPIAKKTDKKKPPVKKAKPKKKTEDDE